MDIKAQTEIKIKAGKGIFVLILRYGLCFILNFVGSIILIRNLGAEVWGQYALSYFALLSFVFLTYGIWGYILQAPETPTKELGMCFAIQQALSFGWALIILIWISPRAAAYFGGDNVALMLMGSALGGYFYSWRWLISAWQERKMDYWGVGASELIDALVFNVTAVILTLRGHGILGIALGNALRGIASALYLRVRARLSIQIGFNWPAFKGIWKFGLPFGFYNSLNWLPNQALPILVGIFLGPAALGYVALAYRLMEYPKVLVTLVVRISISYYSRLAGDLETYRKEMLQGFDYLLLLLSFSIVLLSGLSWLWVPAVYGKDWKLSAIIMMIISVPFIVSGCVSFFSVSLSARGKVNQVALVQLLFNLVFWGTAVILIPRLKDLGLPVSEWVALPFGQLLLYFVVKDSGRLPLSRYIFAILLSALAISGAGLCFHYGYQLWGMLVLMAFVLIWLGRGARQIAALIKYAIGLSGLA